MKGLAALIKTVLTNGSQQIWETRHGFHNMKNRDRYRVEPVTN